MGCEVNLLNALPTKIVRDVAARRKDKARNREIALAFGREYFDGPREQGYGGYSYDGRWIPVAREIISHFNLGPGSRVLDIGCAKGFLVKDLRDACPGIEAFGLDISEYAVRHGEAGSRGRLCVGTADLLPFNEGAFDAVISINTVHNLEPERCRMALREIERLAPGRGFVQVDAYRTEEEMRLFEDWMLTAKTYCDPEGWKALFCEAGYSGDYSWTILERDPETIIS
jgi:SAM-dependent methyltransferase